MSLRSLFCLCVAVLTASCSSVGVRNPGEVSSTHAGGIVDGLGDFFADVTSPTGRKLNQLVEQKKFEEAALLYEQESAFFHEQSRHYEKQLRLTADNLNAARDPELTRVTDHLTSRLHNSDQSVDTWRTAKSEISEADNAIAQYKRTTLLLSDPRYTSKQFHKAERAVAAIRETYRTYAARAFESYNHLSISSFIEVYPVQTNVHDLIPDHLEKVRSQFNSARSDQLAAFFRAYKSAFLQAQVTDLSNLYVEKVLAEQSGNHNFFDKWRAVRKAFDIGLRPNGLKGFRVAVIQLESASQADDRPSLAISRDTDIGLRTLAAGQLKVDRAVAVSDYLVLLHPYTVDIQRKITGKRQVPSRVLAGTRSVPNPAFAAAQAKFIQAQSEYNTERIKNAANPPTVPLAALAQGISESILASAVDKARQELGQTPPMIQQSVYRDYNFDVSEVEVTKKARVAIWVIDRSQHTVARHIEPWIEKMVFKIAYNLQNNDPYRSTYVDTYQNERQLENYEGQEARVNLSGLTEALLRRAPDFSSMQDESSIISEATSNPKAMTVAARSGQPRSNNIAIDDPRLESVVVIKSPTGSLGSGFFVAPDMVVTNAHVVEGSRIAEITMRNGIEAVGRVVKVDIGLDLALIKVTDKGPPVIFSSSQIVVGSTVEAIGHPAGLQFSVTRGIVSAVRKMPNQLVPGSREMLVIQTDAAINPGNSGGPLYFGNQVIGVNSQKLVRREGIGFAIHYLEVQRFVQDQ